MKLTLALEPLLHLREAPSTTASYGVQQSCHPVFSFILFCFHCDKKGPAVEAVTGH